MSSSESILYVLIAIFATSAAVQCTKQTSCSCKTNTGDEINLTPLAGQTALTPRFKDLPDVKNPGIAYSYNPCNPFSEGTGCTNVAICQKASGTLSYPVGTQDTAQFQYNVTTKEYSITYTALQAPILRVGKVYLKCTHDNPGILEVLGENPPLTYSFNLKSCYSCLNGANVCNPSKPSQRLSNGSIILLIFFILLLVYIVGGILFMRYVRHAEGKEIIPNYSFWSSLPGLIKPVLCAVMAIIISSKAGLNAIGTEKKCLDAGSGSSGWILVYIPRMQIS